MIKKQTPNQFFLMVLLVLLIACGKEAIALPPETTIPTAVSPTFIPTSTLIPVTLTPSPLPTQPTIVVSTPDPIQVERWKEYQTALAKSFFSYLDPEEVICEWEFLGRSDQEVYLWAVCMGINPIGTTAEGRDIFSSSSTPAVIHLGEDGAVQSVEIPGAGSDYARDVRRMFPSDVQEKFDQYHSGRAGELSEHLEQRREHPAEPPLVILSVISTVTPTP